VNAASADAGLLLLYGGTFDPVHNGHLAIARAAHGTLRTDVHFMPAADPPHRPAPGATADQRRRMLELATAGERGLRVDPRELYRPGRSYSVDTLNGLRAEVGAVRPIALLIGSDSLLSLHTWHRWTELPTLAHLVVATRPGSGLDGPMHESIQAMLEARLVSDPAILASEPAGRVLMLQQPEVDLSATRIRAFIAAGQPWQAMVPPAVAAYICRHQLYGAPGTASAPV